MRRAALLALLAPQLCSAVPSLAGKSVYFAVTDRFARQPESTNHTACSGEDWCNGTFSGLTAKLDYIAGMGFDCVWITPVVKQVAGVSCNHGGYCGTAYHGYWAEDWWSIDPHLGTADDLRALSAALHARSMCLVLDIVVNHVRPIHSSKDVATVKPFDDPAYYHTLNATPGETFDQYVEHPASAYATHSCSLGNLSCPGYNDTFVKEGWFADLGDLKQEHPFVSRELLRWVRHMVSTFAVDAIRLDTAPYVPMDFLGKLQRAAEVDIVGEVTVSNTSYHASFQRPLKGVLNFPLAYTVSEAFCGRKWEAGPQLTPDMRLLADVLRVQNAADTPYANLDLLGNFADNHDGPRIGRQCAGDRSRLAHALVLVMLARGVPIVYYGTEQAFAQEDDRVSFWQTGYSREAPFYGLLRALNGVRRQHPTLSLSRAAVVHADQSALVFSRGKVAYAFLNNDAESNQTAAPRAYCLPRTAQLPPLPPSGSAWVEALSGVSARFDREKNCFHASSGAPQVLVLQARAEGAVEQ